MGFFEALISAASLAVTAALASPPTAPAPALAAAPIRGVWPVQPSTVAHGFEPPSEAWAAGHRGVDLVSTIGARVFASAGGTVAFAGIVAGRGVVVVSHGDTRTTYEPIIPEVHRAQVVAAGDQIGTLDLTQSHCFPVACLHWGWLRGSEYLDPMHLLPSTRHIRLLPLTPADEPGDKPS